MAQTTGAVVFTGALIEYTIDGGTTYTDISGFGKVVTVEGGERNRGEYFTADGDTPILKAGKRTKQTVTVDAVYTVTLTDPYKVIRDIHITAGGGTTTTIPMIRFSPGGGNTGDMQFVTNANNRVLVNITDPQGDVEPGDIIPFQVVVDTADLTQTVVA